MSKKGNFEKPPKKNGKIRMITDKLFFFGIFVVFFGFFFSLLFLFPLPHLAINPPFFFVLFFFVFLGALGSGEVARISFLFCFVFCFLSFLCFLIQSKTLFFP